jgi:bifunctional DNA-binding transcriptional regulator/antitoxin component of YhaV-PrlF toxin-antitoxin module
VPRLAEWYATGMTVTLSVGEKGRVVLPAALRREAGVQVGDELVARTVGPHQILVETREAVAARLRARFREAGGTDDLRRARAADRAAEELTSVRRSGVSPDTRDLAAEDHRATEILDALEAPGQSAAG